MDNICPACQHKNPAQAKFCERRGIQLMVGSSSWYTGRVLTIVILGTIMVLGIILRLDHLDTRSISHAELYVPNIELPSDLSIPSPRLSFWQNLEGTVWNTHPPAWYLTIMWPWTKLLGSDLFTIRLPSVLFGVASIFLIYVLGILEDDKSTALLSGGLLAFNGHHIFWSQLARPYSVSCFLGLLSSVLLLLLLRKEGRRQGVFLWLYLAVTLYALWADYHLWMIVGTQIIWVLLNSWIKNNLMSGLLLSQLFILILGSPSIAIAILQSKTSSLSSGILFFLKEFIQFGFIFYEPYDSLAQDIFPTFVKLFSFLFFFASLLLIIGFVAKRKSVQKNVSSDVFGPSLRHLAVAATFAFLCTLFIAMISLNYRNYHKTYAIVASSITPFCIFLLAFLMQRHSASIDKLEGLRKMVLSKEPYSLSSSLVIIPVVMFAAVNLFIPFLSSRTMLLLTPYLFIVLSRGIVSISRAVPRFSVVVALSFCLLLAAVHYSSIVIHRERPSSPLDYRGLAEQWISKIKDSDLVFVQRHYILTPIFYYLKADRYRFVGRNYADEVRKNSDSRVWVLSFDEHFDYGVPNEEMRNALSGYGLVTRINARGINVALYSRLKAGFSAR
jgi:4-amino-4-deoxy-L-arabinose transferase-like glycosyltransferase